MRAFIRSSSSGLGGRFSTPITIRRIVPKFTDATLVETVPTLTVALELLAQRPGRIDRLGRDSLRHAVVRRLAFLMVDLTVAGVGGMGMHIDEPGCHIEPFGVDDSRRPARIDRADLRDFLTAYADGRDEERVAGSIENHSVLDDGVAGVGFLARAFGMKPERQRGEDPRESARTHAGRHVLPASAFRASSAASTSVCSARRRASRSRPACCRASSHSPSSIASRTPGRVLAA